MKHFLVVFLFVMTACSIPSNVSPKFCNVDSDCVCGGFDTKSQQCFVGNKQYYESGSVDKSRDCPDFCTGIAGHLETKCVDASCKVVSKSVMKECDINHDCVPSACCHASSCVPKFSAQKCDGVFCTQQCVPGTLDCGGSCACENNKCVGKNLFVQNSDVPIV